MVDLAVVIDLADQVTKLKMFPVFDAAHAALACLAVRDDLGKGKQNPLHVRLHRLS